MDYSFRKLVLKSGKEQLLIEFSPKSDILSSFVESEVASFGTVILEDIQKTIETGEPREFAGNVCLATFEKEYSRVESQLDDKFCILKTAELIKIIEAFLKEKSKSI